MYEKRDYFNKTEEILKKVVASENYELLLYNFSVIYIFYNCYNASSVYNVITLSHYFIMPFPF